MGDRVSIQFEKGTWKSVALFNHWGGRGFAVEALDYALKLQAEAKVKGGMMPLHRLEPDTVMVDFIRELTKGEERITSSLYLGKDEMAGDNSDNGNFVINLGTEPATVSPNPERDND